MISIKDYYKNGYQVYEISGRMCSANSVVVYSEVKKLLNSDNAPVVLDLSKTEHIDLSGISTLSAVNSAVASYGKELTVVGIPDNFRSIIRATSISSNIKIKKTLDDVFDS